MTPVSVNVTLSAVVSVSLLTVAVNVWALLVLVFRSASVTLIYKVDPDSMTELPGHAFKLVSQNASPTRPDMSAVVMLPSCQSTQSVTPHIPPPRLMLKLPGHTFKPASRNAPPPPGLALFR